MTRDIGFALGRLLPGHLGDQQFVEADVFPPEQHVVGGGVLAVGSADVLAQGIVGLEIPNLQQYVGVCHSLFPREPAVLSGLRQ
jgi:hypothetical protein